MAQEVDGKTEQPAPQQRRLGRWVYGATVLVFIAYVGWIIGPYLQSVIVRDAAVTSWLHVATSPIDGTLEQNSEAIHGIVPDDGIIMRVRNDRLSHKNLSEARIRVDHERARAREYRKFLDEIVKMDEERAKLKAHYADVFRAQLDEEIAGMKQEIVVTRKRLALTKKIAGRRAKLVAARNTSPASLDEANLRVSEFDYHLAKLRKDLAYAGVRRKAANKGVFIDHDGRDPNWVRGSRIELKLQKKEARLKLRQIEADLSSAVNALKVAEQDYASQSEAFVRAPAGSIVWNQKTGSGTTVRAGDPVAEWLDCSILMIDVPIADAEAPLIKNGMAAEVVLEGDTKIRKAKVILTRGSAFTLGHKDLAAVAKGRGEGIAQVVLEFSHERKNFQQCPVGRAAYVDFPDIGLIDIIRARLRL